MGSKNTVAVVKPTTLSNETTPMVGDFNYDQRIMLLTADERSQYKELTKSLDTRDVSTVQAYGAQLNSVISNNGDQLLNSVRSDNSNEVIQMTNELLEQINLIDLSDLEDTRWKRICSRIPLLNRFSNRVQKLFNDYDTVAANVDKITKKIATAKIIAQRDNSTLQQIFDNNVTYIKQLRELIMAAKIELQDLLVQVEQMQADPNVEPFEINNILNFQNALEKRIADMETEEYILTQNLFQIQATQHNNVAIAEKSDNIVTNIIPVWKNQIALSIIMNNQKASVEAQHKISETTNEMLRKNAALLKVNSVNVAKESERQVVDLDTLNTVTQNLIETINEVKHIHDEYAQNRKAIEQSLQGFAKQLNDAITQQ